jgi:hypothetical protein
MRQERYFYRLIRGWRPDGNPLRRTSERLETYLLAVLFAASAAVAPFAARAASHWAYAGALQAEHAMEATSHQVTAELLMPAGMSTIMDSYGTQVPTQARWTSVNGMVRYGQIPAPAGRPKGTTLTVWTDASGALTSPPSQPGQASGLAGETAAVVVAGIGVLDLGGAAIIRQVLDRRRMAAWDADWAVTEPRWNHQR